MVLRFDREAQKRSVQLAWLMRRQGRRRRIREGQVIKEGASFQRIVQKTRKATNRRNAGQKGRRPRRLFNRWS